MGQRECGFCGQELTTTFANLGTGPLVDAYLGPDELDRMEPFFPLHVYVCDRCFLVQLPPSVSPETLFRDYPYFSSVSSSWLEHARRYATETIARLGLGPRSRVVEVASNDGYLLQHFQAAGIPVLGVEPAANVAESAVARGIPTVSRFFGTEAARDILAEHGAADLLIGNNVLAHVPERNDFIAGLKLLLAPEGTLTMEFPHLLRMMEETQFDTIFHEHFSYLSLLAVERMFARHGLAIVDVEELPTHGGSLRIHARHAGAASASVGPRVQALREREREAGLEALSTYRDFARRPPLVKRELLLFLLGEKAAGRSIVGYGAAGKGATLLNYCGIGPDILDYVADLSPHKQGKYVPGVRLPIVGPELILETRPDYVLILPWNLREEIVEQLSAIREWGGRFVVPIPGVEVLA